MTLMKLPTPFYDIYSWITMITIILLFTSEALSPYYGRTNIVIDRAKLNLIVRLITLSTLIITFWLLLLHL
jgi:hypothetical protein